MMETANILGSVLVTTYLFLLFMAVTSTPVEVKR